MASLLNVFVKHLSKPGYVMICLLLYSVLYIGLNINLLNVTTHLFRKSERGLKEFYTQYDPDVQLLTRLFNLTNTGFNGSKVLIDVHRLPREEAIKFNRSLYQRRYSSYISSLIPLQRTLPDVRLNDCATIYSNLALPKVSLIIIFHNEHWSTLLRTVHSVTDTTPRHLIQEVLLVDDSSTDKVLKEPLDEYIARRFTNVRVIRAKNRQGLMRARNLGFSLSSAPIVVFMDSHCECFPGWLEPLVARIVENDSVVTTPVLPAVDPINFGIILWRDGNDIGVPVITFPDLFFTHDWLSDREVGLKKRKKKTDPVPAPALVGCVIAVSRVWFTKLGMFDPGLEVWGGENTELSLKTWMCGGRLEIIPCSNVGHMYHPHRQTAELKAFYNRNIARVARVWLDNYAQFVQHYSENVVNDTDIFDRLAIRHSLKCQPFEYYVQNVDPYIHVKGAGIFAGPMRCKMYPTKCTDFRPFPGQRKVSLAVLDFHCREWDFTEYRDIRSNGYCFDSGIAWNLKLLPCHRQRGNQWWTVVVGDDQGHVKIQRDGMCVGVDTETLRLILEPCDSSQRQLWFWRRNREPRIPD